MRDLSSAPVSRASFETVCCGMRLQIWRKMLNLERVGLICCFFTPALWQGYTVEPTLFLSKQWDGCEIELVFRAMEVLESKQAVRRWFNGVVKELGARPVDLCRTARGRRAVLRQLELIENGVPP